MVGRAISCPPFRALIAMLALASGSAGCQFSPSGQAGVDGGDVPGPDPDARRPDAAVIDARDPDARADARAADAREAPDAAVLPPAGELVERNLLTRYFVDEANNGAGETTLDDSADAPLPLTITYAGGNFVQDGSNRGLRWNAITEQGRASATLPAEGKVRQALQGSRQGTIEVVVSIDQFVAGSRLSHIGEADDRGLFTLRLEVAPTPRVRFLLNNDDTEQNYWDINLAGRQRTVLHLVLDTTRSNEAERVRLYVDGEEQQRAGSAAPTRNEAIDIRSQLPSYVLGNKTNGGAGILGAIFYAAMYSTALDPAEVEHNASILRTNDDAP